MFSSTMLSVCLLAASAFALTINTPTNWKGNTTNTVTWTSIPSDPSAFTIELVNTQFNPSIGVANNVQTSLGSVGVPLPRLAAGSDFTLQFVDVSNIGNVLAMSSPFVITENDDTSSSASDSTTASAASTVPGTPGGTPTTLTPTNSATAPIASTTPSAPSTPTSSGSTTVSDTSAASPTTTGSAGRSTSLSGLLAGLAGLVLFIN